LAYTINLEEFDGQVVEVKTGLWKLPRLYINGVLASKGFNRGEMVLLRNDGRQVSATWKSQAFGLDLPLLVVDGKTIPLAPPLKWYSWVWRALPILLVFYGGLLGAIAGFIAFAINANVFRLQMNDALKYVVTAMISILITAIDIVVGSILYILING
jgi:hypothetical protein